MSTSMLDPPLTRPLDVLRKVGISYRQFDYWCRTGSISISVAADGSGSRRALSVLDVARLRVLGMLDRFAWASGAGSGLPGPLIAAVWRYLDRPLDAWPAFISIDADDGDYIVGAEVDCRGDVCLLVRTGL